MRRRFYRDLRRAASSNAYSVLICSTRAARSLAARAQVNSVTCENLTAAADASREAAEIAQKLYEKGLVDFLTVLDAERRRDENEDARAQSHTRLLLNLVRMYKSLGGGWETN